MGEIEAHVLKKSYGYRKSISFPITAALCFLSKSAGTANAQENRNP